MANIQVTPMKYVYKGREINSAYPNFHGWANTLKNEFSDISGEVEVTIYYVVTNNYYTSDAGVQDSFRTKLQTKTFNFDSSNTYLNIGYHLSENGFLSSPNRHYYYYVSYKVGNATWYFPSPPNAETSTYYGISGMPKATNEEDCRIYLTNEYDNGLQYQVQENGGQQVPIECGKYLTINLPQDDSIHGFFLKGKIVQNDGNIFEFSGGEFYSIRKFAGLDYAGLTDSGGQVLIESGDAELVYTTTSSRISVRIEFTETLINLFSEKNGNHIELLVYGATSFPSESSRISSNLNKATTVLITFGTPSIIPILYDIGENENETALTSYENTEYEYEFFANSEENMKTPGKIKIDWTSFNIKPIEIQFKMMFSINNKLQEVIYTDFSNETSLTHEFDMINFIIDNCPPERCFGEQRIFLRFQITDDLGRSFSTQMIKIKVKLERMPAISNFKMYFYNSIQNTYFECVNAKTTGWVGPDFNFPVFASGMEVFVEFNLRVYTTEKVTFQLKENRNTTDPTGIPIKDLPNHGTSWTEEVKNDEGGKINKNGTLITTLGKKQLKLSNFDFNSSTAIAEDYNGMINFLWEMSATGEQTKWMARQQIKNGDNPVVFKALLIPEPEAIVEEIKLVTEGKVEEVGSSFDVFIRELRPKVELSEGTTYDKFINTSFVQAKCIPTKDIYDESKITPLSPLLPSAEQVGLPSTRIHLSAGQNWSEYTFKLRFLYIFKIVVSDSSNSSVTRTRSLSTSCTSQQFSIRNAPPTVAYRVGCVGINTIKPQDYKDAALVVSERIDYKNEVTKTKVYFGSGRDVKTEENKPIGVIDLQTLAISNFIIDCGTW